MPATITATEAKNRFGEVIRRVCKDGETLIVERGGLPVMAIVPMQEYRAAQMSEQARFTRAVRATAREAEAQGLTEDHVEQQVREIRKGVYPSGDEWDETEWLRAAARNPAFDLLSNPEEDIYSLEDGRPFYDQV